MALRFAPEASMVHFIYYDREIPTADCFVKQKKGLPSNVLGVKRSIRRCHCEKSPALRRSAFWRFLQHLGISEEAPFTAFFQVPDAFGYQLV